MLSARAARRVEVVGQAGNGLEALAAVERCEPDLVFLDVQMPGLTGFEVARRLLSAATSPPASGVRHGLRPARDRGVRGECGRLPAEAGRAGRLEQALQRARRRLGTDRPATASRH